MKLTKAMVMRAQTRRIPPTKLQPWKPLARVEGRVEGLLLLLRVSVVFSYATVVRELIEDGVSIPEVEVLLTVVLTVLVMLELVVVLGSIIIFSAYMSGVVPGFLLCVFAPAFCSLEAILVVKVMIIFFSSGSFDPFDTPVDVGVVVTFFSGSLTAS